MLPEAHYDTYIHAHLTPVSVKTLIGFLANYQTYENAAKLAAELQKFARPEGAEVLLYHLKPGFVEELKRAKDREEFDAYMARRRNSGPTTV